MIKPQLFRTSGIWLCAIFMMCCCDIMAQNPLPPIPHKTPYEKWMWPHRKITRIITRERKSYYDSRYVKAYTKQLVVTIPMSTWFLNFDITDRKSADRPKLKYRASDHYDIGLCINSRWASFLIYPGITLFSNDKEHQGTTRQRDFQMDLYGKRLTNDVHFQSYKSFYIKNSSEFNTWNTNNPAQKKYAIRYDAQAWSVGVGMYYVFNYKKFSYRNSFSFTETQLKSAGSPIVGGYWSILGISGDSSLVGYPFSAHFEPSAYIRSGTSSTYGINLGYIYTLVIRKKFHITVSTIPGLGLAANSYTLSDNSNHENPLNLNYKLNIRAAIGYDNGDFFCGTMAVADYFYYSSTSDATFDYNYGKARVYLGYRFNILRDEKKLLRKLGLIDWDKK